MTPHHRLALVETAPEHALIGALISRPELLAALPEDMDTDNCQDFRVQAALAAIWALHLEGTPIVVGLVDDQMMRQDQRTESEIEWLTSCVMAAGEPMLWTEAAVRSVAERVTARTADKKRTIKIGDIGIALQKTGDVADAIEKLEAIGADNTEPDDSGLIVPLESFLGDAEPDDDDSEDWSIRDLVPRGEPWMFAGPWKLGKTWAAIGIAVAIALGVDFVGFKNEIGRPGRVLLILLEDGKRRLRKRLWQVCRGFGTTPNDPRLRDHLVVSRTPLRLPGDPKQLASHAAAVRAWGADVVIVDSLSRVMDGDQLSVRDASAFTAAWMQLCERTGAAWGFIHHTNKTGVAKPGDVGDPFDRIRGSGDLLAAPRHLVVVQRLDVEGAKISEILMRGNLDLRRESFALEFRQEDHGGKKVALLSDAGDPADLKESAKQAKSVARKSNATAVTESRYTAALKTARDRGGCSGDVLAAVIGQSKATADRALRSLEDLGLLGEVGPAGRPITSAGFAWLDERGVS